MERGRSTDAERRAESVRAEQVVGQQQEDSDDQRHDNRSRTFNLSAVLNALNAQVNELSTTQVGESEDENDDDASATLRVAGVTTMSLATIVTRLSATDAASLTAAVNANTVALQAFLNGGTPAANAIVAALNEAGISPDSVLAILPSRDGELVVLLA
ncbi:MAG: hypothetical protein NVSMB2_17090 [Chloroflexota bacterium]